MTLCGAIVSEWRDCRRVRKLLDDFEKESLRRRIGNLSDAWEQRRRSVEDDAEDDDAGEWQRVLGTDDAAAEMSAS